MKNDIVIASACRTPVGRFGGSFLEISAASLGSYVIAEAIQRANIESALIDEVVLGCVLQAGVGQNVARQSAIMAGIPIDKCSMTVNMVCGSGLKAVCLASLAISSGESDIIVAGGTENMSQSPFLLKEMRWGTKKGEVRLIDSMVNDALTDAFGNYTMGITAENIADLYKITREEQDLFAVMSQNRAEKAQYDNLFNEEIVSVQSKIKDQLIIVEKDENIRYGTTFEKISSLKPVFKTNGTVTAGNSSTANDGAAALVLMSREKANMLGIKPLARILSYATAGVDPSVMGIGPVESCKKALKNACLTIDDIGLAEINEAFAVQTIAVVRDLNIRIDKLNVNGGAIALGHPIGASGARILVTLIHQMRRKNIKYGMAAACIGGGMGITIIVENEEIVNDHLSSSE